MKKLRTKIEQQVGKKMARIFDAGKDSTEIKLENFPKYVRRQQLKRFLALYELFKLVMPIKGSIIECGVFRGFGLMSWAKLSAMLEPENLTRRIYGFDSFKGFTSVNSKDANKRRNPRVGDLCSDSFSELKKIIAEYNKDRFLGHIDKVHLVKGDVRKTIPAFIKNNPHLVVSLLFLDVDLYDPTRVAIENFLPRMSKNAVIAFDELDNPLWPGETLAAIESIGLGRIKLQRLEWDPYMTYAILS